MKYKPETKQFVVLCSQCPNKVYVAEEAMMAYGGILTTTCAYCKTELEQTERVRSKHDHSQK